MRDLTLIFAIYGQPLMLAHQFAAIRGYPATVLDRLNVVVVDDCGTPAVDVREVEALAVGVKSAKLFRVTQDIPWNQPGARNLAMHHAAGVCVMIDPDMVISGKTMESMMEVAEKLPRRRVVKFGLRHVSSGRADMSSPNTWLLHRDDFFAVGGYDEDFSGNKGWSDCQLFNILSSCYKIDLRPDLLADFHGTDSVPDAMVTSLDRSVAVNRKKRMQKAAQARAAGGWARWVKTRKNVPRLRFPWQQVYP
jgi:hypothetical protein